MPISGSYHYPTMNRPPGTVKLTKLELVQAANMPGGAQVIFSGSAGGGGLKVSDWSNISITVNNTGSNDLGTIAVQFSPDNTNWENWETSCFSGLAAGAITSIQISGQSRNYMRLRANSQPTATGVIIHVTLNNG